MNIRVCGYIGVTAAATTGVEARWEVSSSSSGSFSDMPALEPPDAEADAESNGRPASQEPITRGSPSQDSCRDGDEPEPRAPAVPLQPAAPSPLQPVLQQPEAEAARPALPRLLPAVDSLHKGWVLTDSESDVNDGDAAACCAEPGVPADAAKNPGGATTAAWPRTCHIGSSVTDPGAACCSCITRTVVIPGDVAWYLEHLWQVTWRLRHLHCGEMPGWPLRRDVLCAGSCPELWASIAFQREAEFGSVHVCEKKVQAQTWISEHFAHLTTHCFDSNDSILGGGYCWQHKRQCVPANEERTDIMSAGYPCPPFSKQRDKSGSTDKTSKADDHPELRTLMDGFPKYLRSNQPRCWFIENVVEMAKVCPRGSLQTFLAILLYEVAQLGYSCRAIVLEHETYIVVPRRRLFVFGCSSEAGGKVGVEWVTTTVLDLYAERKSTPPSPLSCVWQPEHPYEQQRIKGAKDFHYCIISY